MSTLQVVAAEAGFEVLLSHIADYQIPGSKLDLETLNGTSRMEWNNHYAYSSETAAANTYNTTGYSSEILFQPNSSSRAIDRYLPWKYKGLEYRSVSTRLQNSIRYDLKEPNDNLSELPEASLCSQCLAIFDNDHSGVWFEEAHAHHISRADVEYAVEQGCRICSMIKDALPTKRPDWVSSQGQHLTRDRISGISYRIEIEGWTGDRLVFDLDGIQLLDLQMLHPHDTDHRITRDHLLPTNRSEQSMSIARHWLATCRMKHYKCGDLPAVRSRCPTRLLEVCNSTGTTKAKLWCSDEHPDAMPPYLTLSHCWGNLNIYTLTTDNMRQLKNSIQLNLLPPVFQDALQVTLELGYQYLWIDSLCICQDSTDDWLHESSTMDTVYREADCNLAATGFPDGRNGLFVQRNWGSTYPSKVSTRWTGNWLNGSQPRLQCYYIVDDQIWKAGVDRAPLNKRCWVLQERLLSPCTLHFGDQQLFWECSEATCCEIYPTGFPSDLGISSVKLGFDHKTVSLSHLKHDPRVSYNSGRYRVHEVYRAWHKTVEAYTSGKLTRSTDRMLAIAGAAKRFKSILGDEFLAGLWRHHLLRDLLWSVMFDSTVVLQTTFIAPSWSWFSVDAAVMFITGSYPKDGPEIEHSIVLEARVDTTNQGEFGALEGGLLKIKGPLAILAPKNLGYYSSEWNVDGQKIKINIDFDVCGSKANPDLLHTGPLVAANGTGRYSVSMDEHHAILLLARRPSFVLPLMTDEDLEVGEPFMKGLLLGHCDGVKGQFIRLGVWTAETDEAKKLLLQKHEKLPDEFFLDFDGSCMYTIDIV